MFGVALGGSIRVIDGVEYEQFIVPGLVLMGVATSAFGNNATSIYQARSDGFIEDPASSPMSPSQLLVGYMAGGVVRSLLIGVLTLGAARLFVDFPMESRPSSRWPWSARASRSRPSARRGPLLDRLGPAERGRQPGHPAARLPGRRLLLDHRAPPAVAGLTHADPIFYMVVAARHGVLGDSEVGASRLGVTLGLAVAHDRLGLGTFVRGVGIRT